MSIPLIKKSCRTFGGVKEGGEGLKKGRTVELTDRSQVHCLSDGGGWRKNPGRATSVVKNKKTAT